MTDRELLELAALAAGIKVEYINATAGAYFWFPNTGFKWNPLADDADAARLEAALQLHVEWHPALNQVRVGTAEIHATESYGNDRQAARRRAGVCAAAELGLLIKTKQDLKFGGLTP